ncbi:MAG: hypothetical protein KatS3mg110_4228 [Pirellulaceae bacterium]|nr:MAG: hypothetical protein KatS3mg110_4228 [Pirellulaceae bacterium]
MCRTASRAWLVTLIAWAAFAQVASVLRAQDVDDRPIPLSVGSPAGARVYKPGYWAPVGVEVANPTNEPCRVTATFYFSLDPHVQYRRELYVPPNTKRLATCLIQTPRLEGRDINEAQRYRKTFDLYTIVADEQGDVLPGLTGELTRNSFLVKHLENISSAMFPNEGPLAESAFPRAYDAAIALRLAAGLTRRIGEFAKPVFPDSIYELDAIQQITLHNNEPFQDGATVLALRSWLMRGGRLWIMLDQVDPANVQWLLGDQPAPLVIDRTQLTDFQLRSTDPNGEAEEQVHERPVEFVRVLVDQAEVTHTVDGYPAAFFQTFGLGRVLYTTLGPAAWVRPARRYEIRPDDPERQAVFLARPALATLATRLLVPVEQMPWSASDWRSYLETRIGYRILDRTSVATFLGIYLVGLGLIVWRMRKREQTLWRAGWLIGWMVASALPLAAWGWKLTTDVPATLGQGQLVLARPGSRDVLVQAGLAAFQHAPQTLPIRAGQSAVLTPDSAGLEGSVRQLIFEDTERWRWENLRLPAGVRMARLEAVRTLDAPVRIEVTFGSRGIEGRISGLPFGQAEDAVLLMPDGGALALHLDQDGRFWAGAEDVLAEGRFVAAALVSDEQRRRQSLLEAAVSRRVHTLFPKEPTVLFWGPPVPLALALPDRFQQFGTALYQLRFEWQRPPPGTHVLVPSALLRFSPAAVPGSRGVATTYDPHRRQWLRMATPSETWLRVQLPGPLIPLAVERLRIDGHIEAADRQVELLVRQPAENRVRVVARYDSPAGPFHADVRDREWIQPDSDGGVWVALHVSEHRRPSDAAPEWQVHYLRVTLEGRIP